MHDDSTLNRTANAFPALAVLETVSGQLKLVNAHGLLILKPVGQPVQPIGIPAEAMPALIAACQQVARSLPHPVAPAGAGQTEPADAA